MRKAISSSISVIGIMHVGCTIRCFVSLASAIGQNHLVELVWTLELDVVSGRLRYLRV